MQRRDILITFDTALACADCWDVHSTHFVDVLCCVVLCCVVLCCVLLCCVVFCCVVLCVLCCFAVFFCVVLCCVLLCCAVLCCIVFCCVVLCCVVLCFVVPCCAVLYHLTLHCSCTFSPTHCSVPKQSVAPSVRHTAVYQSSLLHLQSDTLQCTKAVCCTFSPTHCSVPQQSVTACNVVTSCAYQQLSLLHRCLLGEPSDDGWCRQSKRVAVLTEGPKGVSKHYSAHVYSMCITYWLTTGFDRFCDRHHQGISTRTLTIHQTASSQRYDIYIYIYIYIYISNSQFCDMGNLSHAS